MKREQLILLLAADEFEEEGNWCQKAHARRADGSACPVFDPAAASYCVLGLVDRITGDRDIHTYVRAIDLIHDVLQDVTVVGWNDTPGRTVGEVVALLRQAAGRYPAEVV